MERSAAFNLICSFYCQKGAVNKQVNKKVLLNFEKTIDESENMWYCIYTKQWNFIIAWIVRTR